MDDVITLISGTKVQDDYGNWTLSDRTEKELLCKVNSVTRQEFFEGGRNGLNPSFVFTVFAGDYEGETLCRYRGNQYSVYRTYYIPGTDYLELYVERKGGTNG